AALERLPPRTSYLLHGDETFLVERALALLRERVSAAGAVQVRTLWAGDDTGKLPAALDDLSSPLLFGGTQVLVVRRAEALGSGDEEMVLAACGRVRLPACLLLIARGLDGRRRLLAAFERDRGAFAFPRVTDAATLRDWVVRLARERGHAIRPQAADLLIE